MYHYRDGNPLLHDNHLIYLYFILPLATGIVNIIVKAYSFWINRYLDKLPFFTVGSVQKMEDKFSISLCSLIGITAICLFGIFSSFSEREMRLKFFFPLQVMVLSIIMQFLIIINNEKIKHFCILKFIKPWEEKFQIFRTLGSPNIIRPG